MESIKNYIELARRYGFDPYKDLKDMITDELIQNIKYCAGISNCKYLIPKNELLLPE